MEGYTNTNTLKSLHGLDSKSMMSLMDLAGKGPATEALERSIKRRRMMSTTTANNNDSFNLNMMYHAIMSGEDEEFPEIYCNFDDIPDFDDEDDEYYNNIPESNNNNRNDNKSTVTSTSRSSLPIIKNELSILLRPTYNAGSNNVTTTPKKICNTMIEQEKKKQQLMKSPACHSLVSVLKMEKNENRRNVLFSSFSLY